MVTPNAREVAEVVACEGQQGLVRLLRDCIHLFRADPNFAESLYRSVKEESPGAAFLFAYVLRSRGIVLSGVNDDLAQARRENPGLWVMGVAHMCSPSVLGRAREALEAGDVLCGYQHHLGGCSPTAVMFSSFSGFEEHLRSTRPGDLFALLSVQRLAAQNALIEPT